MAKLKPIDRFGKDVKEGDLVLLAFTDTYGKGRGEGHGEYVGYVLSISEERGEARFVSGNPFNDLTKDNYHRLIREAKLHLSPWPPYGHKNSKKFSMLTNIHTFGATLIGYQILRGAKTKN